MNILNPSPTDNPNDVVVTRPPETILSVVVTCHTPDCPNDGVPYQVSVAESTSAAVCGGCGVRITDVVADPDAEAGAET